MRDQEHVAAIGRGVIRLYRTTHQLNGREKVLVGLDIYFDHGSGAVRINLGSEELMELREFLLRYVDDSGQVRGEE